MEFSELLQRLYRNRLTIIWATIGLFAIATAIGFILPPRYTSECSFIPPTSGNSSAAAALMGQLSQMSAFGMGGGFGPEKGSADLYVGILKSHLIACELVHRFDLQKVYKAKKESAAEERLAINSSFEVGMKDSIVRISVTDKDPGRARDMANAYLDILRETNGHLALSESSQRRLFFGQQLAKEKDDLEVAEVDLKKTEEQSGLIAPTGQTAVEIDTIAQTQAQIAVRQMQLAALHQGETEQGPNVVRLKSEIDDLQGQLSRLQSGGAGKSTAAIPASKVPELQLEYVRKEREVKYHEALFDMLSRQYEAARLDEAQDSPVLQILDPASYPDSRSGPKRLFIMLGGLFLGFFAGCFWVVVRERVYAFSLSVTSAASE